jgi:hypothetical protein
MQRVLRNNAGEVRVIVETIRLGHDIFDKNDPIAYKKIWVLHNTEGPALIDANGKKEYYFYGIYKGNTYDAIRDFKRNHNGLPPAKNPMFKSVI